MLYNMVPLSPEVSLVLSHKWAQTSSYQSWRGGCSPERNLAKIQLLFGPHSLWFFGFSRFWTQLPGQKGACSLACHTCWLTHRKSLTSFFSLALILHEWPYTLISKTWRVYWSFFCDQFQMPTILELSTMFNAILGYLTLSPWLADVLVLASRSMKAKLGWPACNLKAQRRLLPSQSLSRLWLNIEYTLSGASWGLHCRMCKVRSLEVIWFCASFRPGEMRIPEK